ncbi:MAG: hypothetical protein NVSMB46_00310 [Candidatus Saccharimonadales bacterium]
MEKLSPLDLPSHYIKNESEYFARNDEFNPALDGLKSVSRQNKLQRLLDPPALPVIGPADPNSEFSNFPNYEYAHDSGILDQFYYDPKTGEDDIIHILSGDLLEDSKDRSGMTKLASGFHHEPSASHSQTYVDRLEIKNKSSKHRVQYQEYPFEPYKAQVIVKGYQKSGVFKKNEDDQAVAIATGSNMFPREYDALTVLKTAILARDTRDKNMDKIIDNKIIAQGSVLYLDGKHEMKIHLILDKDSNKIITAFPLVERKPGVMKLDLESINTYLGL